MHIGDGRDRRRDMNSSWRDRIMRSDAAKASPEAAERLIAEAEGFGGLPRATDSPSLPDASAPNDEVSNGS